MITWYYAWLHLTSATAIDFESTFFLSNFELWNRRKKIIPDKISIKPVKYFFLSFFRTWSYYEFVIKKRDCLLFCSFGFHDMCTLQDSFLVFVIIYWVESRYLNFLAINVISVGSLNSGIIANLIFVPAIIIFNNFDEKKKTFQNMCNMRMVQFHSFFLSLFIQWFSCHGLCNEMNKMC